jgi:hypothetical protein
MKNLLKTTLLLTVLSFAIATANAQTGQIVFETTSHNFGSNIPEKGGDVTYRFMFTNTGDAPVTIQKVNASCGCTTPGWIKEPVAPGQQGYVDAKYSPNGRPGAFTKSLTVTSTGEPKMLSLTISGNVVKAPLSVEEEFPVALEGVRLNGKVFAFARVIIDTKEEKASIIRIYNSSDAPVEISLKNIPEYLKTDVLPLKLEPKQKGEIKASYVNSKKITYGTKINELDLYINGKKVESLTSNITIIPSPAVADKNAPRPILNPINNNYTFSNIPQGTPVPQDFKFINAGQADLEIIAVNVVNEKGSNLKIEYPKKPIKPGEEGVIKVLLSTKKLEGPQDFNIELITNVAANPVSTISMRGNVVK